MSSILPNDLNFSACIDEYDDNLESSIKSIKKKPIDSMSILNINGKYISDLPDDTLLKIKSMLANITVHAIKLDIGFKTTLTDAGIDKQLSVAKFFGASRVIVGICKNIVSTDEALKSFTNRIADKCISLALLPIIEMSTEMMIESPDDMVAFISRYKKIKLLYDPCRFMERANTQPYIKWWGKIKTFVDSIVVRDFKTGFGFSPAGHGDTKIIQTVDEFIQAGGRNLIFKPSLGRRYGSVIGKNATFDLGYDIFTNWLRGNTNGDQC
jgi:hypothetical protein